MARKISRKNGSVWGLGKGLWGNANGEWLPAKKAWANNGGVWTQVWPPDLTFTSFVVTATTGEVGYTNSLISWSMDHSVPGTVSIQRMAPGGSWTDIATGLAISGSFTQTPLAPPQGAAGTWSFRALFIPTHDPSFITYSSTDTVSLTVSTGTMSVTAASGEVYYTSSLMTWSFTGSIPGTVKVQRRLGAGAWSDVAAGLAKSGSNTYPLTPAGAALNGTWSYRALFTPTVDPTWNISSTEDTATLTYRSRGTIPTAFRWILPESEAAEFIDADVDFGWSGLPSSSTPVYAQDSGVHVGCFSGEVGTMDWAALSSITVSAASNRYYAWGPDFTKTYQLLGADTPKALTFGLTPTTGNHKDEVTGQQVNSKWWTVPGGVKWSAYIDWKAWPDAGGIGGPVWGWGFNVLGGAVASTITLTWEDGNFVTRSVTGQAYALARRTY